MMNLKSEHIIIGGAALALWWMNRKKEEKKVVNSSPATQQPSNVGDPGGTPPVYDLNYGNYMTPGSLIGPGMINLVRSQFSTMDEQNIRSLLSNPATAYINEATSKMITSKQRSGYSVSNLERVGRCIKFVLLTIGNKQNNNQMTILGLFPQFYNGQSSQMFNGVRISQPVFFRANCVDTTGLLVPGFRHNADSNDITNTYPTELNGTLVNIINANNRVYEHDGIPAIGGVLRSNDGQFDSPQCIADNGNGVGVNKLAFRYSSSPEQLHVGSVTINLNGSVDLQINGDNSMPYRSCVERLGMSYALPENSSVQLETLSQPVQSMSLVAQGQNFMDAPDGLWRQGGDPSIDPYYSLTRYMANHNLFDPNVKAPPSVANIVKAGINRIWNQDNKVLGYEIGGLESAALTNSHSNLSYKEGGA